MGKQGPCCHCGVTSTPLWRNGPPEKPVLCNACGSRWRTKGSLTNYTPMHCREFLDPDEAKISKVKSITFKPKEQKSHKKKSNVIMEYEREMPYSDQNFRRRRDEDTSNRSSSGSAISYSESCAYFGNTDASDLTGSAQSNVLESLVPSRKRTCVTRPKPSSVEMLTKDLYSILQEQESSYYSESFEEDLLYDSETLMDSMEIGHGGVLIKNPNLKTVEEESEASSLPVDTKSYILNEAYSGTPSLSVNSESRERGSLSLGTEKYRKPSAEVEQEHLKRDKVSNEKSDILRDRDSPLCSTDLKDIVSFKEFMELLTSEEQKRLMKYLPSVDTAKPPESLQSMFNSPQFRQTLSIFQLLILEGVFDLSFSKTNAEECRTLKKLALHDLTKARWVEHYKHSKDTMNKQIEGRKEIFIGTNYRGNSKSASLKRVRDSQNQIFSDLGGTIRSPKKVSKPCGMNPPSTKIPQLKSKNEGLKAVHCADEFVDNEASCFSPSSFFASPPERSSMLAPLQFTDESSDQDLLLDAPYNAPDPEAELLYHPWRQKRSPSSSIAGHKVTEGEDSLSNLLSSSSTSK